MYLRDSLINIIKQCSCCYITYCDGDCGLCNGVEMFDKQIEHIADAILASGLMFNPDDDTTCDHCACELLDQRDKAREEAERYKRYYFHHEYDKWESEIKTATVAKMQEKLKTYLREVAHGEIGSDWIDQIAEEILEDKE